jgi:hypothetical protein
MLAKKQMIKLALDCLRDGANQPILIINGELSELPVFAQLKSKRVNVFRATSPSGCNLFFGEHECVLNTHSIFPFEEQASDSIWLAREYNYESENPNLFTCLIDAIIMWVVRPEEALSIMHATVLNPEDE